MSGTAIIELAGVLRSDAGGPIPEGRQLYQALASQYRLVLVAEDVDDEFWLTTNGLKEHAQLLVGSMQLVVQRARASMGDVRLIVTPNPSTAAATMHAGVTALLFAHPRFARPEFRSDVEREPKPWDEIVQEIDAQRHASVRVPHHEGD